MKKSFLHISVGLFFLFSTVFSFPFTLQAAFEDVPANHPYIRDIEYLETKGIVKEKSFSPDEKITREDFAKWVLKNAGFNSESYKPKSKKRFFDVPLNNNPNAPYIYRLYDLGAIKPPSDQKKTFLFQPKQPITKREALEWLFAVEGIPVPQIFDEANFKATDLRSDSKLAPLVYKAVNMGLLEPGRVKIAESLKRGQAARFLKVVKASGPALTVTILPTGSGGGSSDLTRTPEFEVMNAVWNRIFQAYLRSTNVKKDQLLYGSIEGLVKQLDDKYSTFERPGDNSVIDSLSGQVEGIGAVIELREEKVIIISPIAGSPAEKAGHLPEDHITAVDDVDVAGMKLSDVVAKIKGKKGTSVKLDITRGEQKLEINVVRDIVRIVSASLKRTSDNIAQITLTNFGQNSYSELLTIVKELKANPPRGIVLDLRNNPGGFLTTAVEIAGFFVKNGDKVVDVRYPSNTEMHSSRGAADLSGYRTVVLINKGSASAAEILAGTLKDHNLATLVGETTFGKGTVQELTDFSDGSTLKLTVAEWLTPKGALIEKNGVKPDIEVTMSEEDKRLKRDPQMDRALQEVRR